MYPGRSGKMKAGNTNGSSADKECLQLLGDNGGGTADLQVGKPAKGETHQQTRGLLTLHGDKDEAIPTKMKRKMEKTKTSRARCPLARSPCLTVLVFPLGQHTALFGRATQARGWNQRCVQVNPLSLLVSEE